MFYHLRRLAGHTAVYGVSDLLGRAVSFILVPLYARRLSEAENGMMGVAFAFIAFSGIVYTLGFNQAILRYFGGAGSSAERRRTFSSAVIAIGGVSILLSAVMWSGADRISEFLFDLGDKGRFVRMAAVILLLDSLSGVPLNALRALEKPAVYAGIKVAQFTLSLILNIYLIVFAGRGLGGVFESNILSSFFALLCCLPFIIRYLRPKISIESLRKMLSFGLPFIPSVLAVLVIDVSDRYFVRRFLGLEEAGVYNILYKFGMVMALATSAFRSAWLPFFMSVSKREDAGSICARTMTYFLLAGMGICVSMILFLDEIVGWIAGPGFLKGKGLVPILLVSYLVYGMYVNLMAGVYAKERTRILPAVVGAGATVNILLNICLVPPLGLIGAAWSTLSAYITMATLLLVWERGFYPVAYEWGRVGKILSVGAGISILGLWSGLGATLSGVTGRFAMLAAYPAVLWGLGAFNREEIGKLRDLFFGKSR